MSDTTQMCIRQADWAYSFCMVFTPLVLILFALILLAKLALVSESFLLICEFPFLKNNPLGLPYCG